MSRSFLLTCALVAGLAPASYAHHPYAVYDMGREVTVTGELERATFAEPHSFLQVRDVAPDGQDVMWIVELKGVGALRALGLTPRTLKAGDRLTLTGHPGRVAAERRLWLTTLVRVRDGWTWRAP